MFVQSETFRSGSVWISGSSAAGQTTANTSDLHEAAERTKFTSSITFPVLIHNPTEGWGGGPTPFIVIHLFPSKVGRIPIPSDLQLPVVLQLSHLSTEEELCGTFLQNDE